MYHFHLRTSSSFELQVDAGDAEMEACSIYGGQEGCMLAIASYFWSNCIIG